MIETRNREREKWSDEKKREMETLYSEALEVTLRIMTKVRQRASGIPIYLFNACGPISDKEKKICDAAQFNCIKGVHEHVTQLEGEGKKLKVVNNDHWNREGNQVVGEWLVAVFRDQSIL